MRVTCGPTASINISEEIEPYTAEQAGNAIALETTEVDLGGHEDPSSSTHTQYGMGMQDICMLTSFITAFGWVMQSNIPKSNTKGESALNLT